MPSPVLRTVCVDDIPEAVRRHPVFRVHFLRRDVRVLHPSVQIAPALRVIAPELRKNDSMQPRFFPIVVNLMDVEALRLDRPLQDGTDAAVLFMNDDFALMNILFQFLERRQMTDPRVKGLSVDIKNLASIVVACRPPEFILSYILFMMLFSPNTSEMSRFAQRCMRAIE